MSPGEFRQRNWDHESRRQPEGYCPEDGRPSRTRLGRLAHGTFAVRRFLLTLGVFTALAIRLPAAESTSQPTAPAAVSTNAAPHFEVQTYVVHGNSSVFTNVPAPALSDYTGTNVSLEQIVKAAAQVLLEYQKQGYPKANIAIARELITNGVVTMNVFQGAFPQVLISGKPCALPGETGVASALAATAPKATNTTTAVETNAEPRFTVRAYEVTGDTLLSTNTLLSIFAKGVGTNITLGDINQAASDLQMEYRKRGFPTVNVTIPPQQITNAMVKIHVFEGRLSDIVVTGNRYFSSNNVMRALPSLHTNIILLRPVFQAELDRANANQDRQIYPQIEPGAEPNTTILDLVVKDRLPLHAKVELNNQNSPGTPDLRVNSSVVYNNLWQQDQSIGVQYSFSPELYKQGDQWDWYDRPLVANYSGFYRLVLGNPGSISEQIESQPGTFGYSEATRKFNLPPSSGAPELNLYASRSTIDTGVQILDTQTLLDIPDVRDITRQDSQQDLTVNNTLGFRLTAKPPEVAGVVSTLSGGLDYKTYGSDSFKTNTFTFTEITLNSHNQPNPPVISKVISPVPPTFTEVHYLPLTLRWDGSREDAHGLWTGFLGYSVNFFGALFANSAANFEKAAGSSQAGGAYQVVTFGLGREEVFYKDWRLTLHADGQWANQPLISNEQFGTGGVGSVRGYHEGEVFGDTGWHVSLEQKTPGLIIGSVGRNHPLIVRGSVYMDYAESYLLDPQGRDKGTPLWGTGLGLVASVGSTWEARFLFSVPLLPTTTIEACQPYFNFSLKVEF